MRPWVIYSLARVGIFLALLVILLVLGIDGWIAAIAATLMALAISYLALGTLRNRVAAELFEAREKREAGIVEVGEDEAAEDRA